jgi:hypothetical protein
VRNRLIPLMLGVCAAAAVSSAASAGPIVGSINFAGSDRYNTTLNVVDFVNPATVTSDTLGFPNPCVDCGVVAGATSGVFNYSAAFPAPPAKPLLYDNLLVATAAGKVFSFDLETVTQIIEEPNVSLAIEGTGLLHLTGSDDTPGSFFFSTQGPENIEVSFSATNVAAPVREAAGWTVLLVGLVAMAVLKHRQGRRSAVTKRLFELGEAPV